MPDIPIHDWLLFSVGVLLVVAMSFCSWREKQMAVLRDAIANDLIESRAMHADFVKAIALLRAGADEEAMDVLVRWEVRIGDKAETV